MPAEKPAQTLLLIVILVLLFAGYCFCQTKLKASAPPTPVDHSIIYKDANGTYRLLDPNGNEFRVEFIPEPSS